MSDRRSWYADLGYASGNFGKSLQNTTIGLVYLYFLVDVLGISAALAGTLLLLSQVWECLTDPLLGHLIDRKLGGGRTYNKIILYSLPLSALSFIGIFWIPSLADSATGWWILLSCLLFRAAYALVDVTHRGCMSFGTATALLWW